MGRGNLNGASDGVSGPRRNPVRSDQDVFVFNGDYRDLEQVAEWLPEFAAIREALVADGRYPYNDAFKGMIVGIANPERRGPSSGTHEDTAIYLLQGLYRKRENAERIAAALADGCEPLDTLESVTKFSRVIVYDDQDRMRGPIWQEWEDARVVPGTGPHQDRLHAVLPKGRRTQGAPINGRNVMVKR